MSDNNSGWVKIDLSNLDKTGKSFDIYMLGYAAASGQIVQQDPASKKILMSTPAADDVVVPPSGFSVSGKEVTLATAATLYVGGKVTFSDSSTATINSISARVVCATGSPGKWKPFTNPTWTDNSNAVLQNPTSISQGTFTNETAASEVTGIPSAAAAAANPRLGMLVTGITPPPPGAGGHNTFFFPCDSNGFPGTPKASDAAGITAISTESPNTSLTLSQKLIEAGPVKLAPSLLQLNQSGTNSSGYATFKKTLPGTDLSTPNVLLGDLLSTGTIDGYDKTVETSGSSLIVEGVVGNAMVYSVVDYVITLSENVPAGSSLTFSCEADGTVSSDGKSITLSAATYPGIASTLALGQKPRITHGATIDSSGSITGLSLSGATITATLNSALPSTFHNQSAAIALPPTGGTLPVFKWDATTNNAIWAEQTPGPAGSLAVNGSRIYFVLDTLSKGPPSFGYKVGISATGTETVAVTQPADEAVWSGEISPFQYIELTIDSMGSRDGLVYIDLSAVDGFFYPAALSSDKLMVGQPPGAYTDPSGKVYAAVTREDILGAWETTFSAANTFKSEASALRAAYVGLKVSGSSGPIGIQNPTFSYATPNTANAAFDSCWDTALVALFAGRSPIDLQGDLLIVGAKSYYKGAAVTVGSYRAIELTEYKSDYDESNKTGGKFWIFDPRTPPPTENQAFVPEGAAMAVGYQVFANTGVFASIALTIGGDTPNYKARTAKPFSADDALKQLTALQRDVVTAMNRGIGASGIGTGTVGATTDYWNTETNWYPYAAPYGAFTPQNLFSQWVHTAVIDQDANKFYATYPFGAAWGYGDPVHSANSDGAGKGPLMNQTYGFGYDETPNNGSNVPAKYLPIANHAGSTLAFSLSFGPWS